MALFGFHGSSIRRNALLAFGGRLKKDDFAVIGSPERLDQGNGYRRAQKAASAAGITIAEGLMVISSGAGCCTNAPRIHDATSGDFLPNSPASKYIRPLLTYVKNNV